MLNNLEPTVLSSVVSSGLFTKTTLGISYHPNKVRVQYYRAVMIDFDLGGFSSVGGVSSAEKWVVLGSSGVATDLTATGASLQQEGYFMGMSAVFDGNFGTSSEVSFNATASTKHLISYLIS